MTTMIDRPETVAESRLEQMQAHNANLRTTVAVLVIIAGIKVATIWVFGTATLATPVGADSLGYYIFLGLNTRNDAVTLFGCLVAMSVALLLYKLIGAIQQSVEDRHTGRTAMLAAVTAALTTLLPSDAVSCWKTKLPVRLWPSAVIASNSPLVNTPFSPVSTTGMKWMPESRILSRTSPTTSSTLTVSTTGDITSLTLRITGSSRTF